MYSHCAPPKGLVVGVVGRHHSIDEIVVALVELVVSDGGYFESGGVECVDRRLVLLDERFERRGADEVACRGEDGVRVRAPQLLDCAREDRAPASSFVVLFWRRPWKSFVARIWICVSAACAAGLATSSPALSARIAVPAPVAILRRDGEVVVGV